MSRKLHLTLACGDYEIVRDLKEGTVRPDGIELTVLTEMDSTTRHWRFLRNREFDVAEVSASSYLIARDNDLPFRALPVFLHRRFRHGFAFVNAAAGIETPQDLIGRRVGVKSYQVTAILWLRGILEENYGVPHKSIHWFSELDEDVSFERPADLKLETIPPEKSLVDMLCTGELDAVLHPDLIAPIRTKDPRVRRLFPDHRREEEAYYAKTGIFPIMHVMGLKREIVEAHPWAAINLQQAFEESKRRAMGRMENPRIVPLAWYREAWEEQEERLGPDPWAYGLGEANARNIGTLARYSHEQGLISREIPLDELFLPTSTGRKRGGDIRI